MYDLYTKRWIQTVIISTIDSAAESCKIRNSLWVVYVLIYRCTKIKEAFLPSLVKVSLHLGLGKVMIKRAKRVKQTVLFWLHNKLKSQNPIQTQELLRWLGSIFSTPYLIPLLGIGTRYFLRLYFPNEQKRVGLLKLETNIKAYSCDDTICSIVTTRTQTQFDYSLE